MDTRRCATCQTDKPLTEYFFRDPAHTKPQHQCKDCTNAYKREWYLKNSVHHISVSEAAKRERVGRNMRRLRDYLSEHPCVDCGESDPVVLEFDHVRGEKIGNVSRLLRGRPWRVILEEIEKCEVRCANCHRRRTAAQQGWYESLAGVM